MAEFPALPLWTDAYLGDTTHLTTIEHGAYLLLLMTAWRTTEARLPDDDQLLARYVRMTPGQWKRMRPIIAAFFTIQNGFWTQGRLTDEAVAVRQKKEAAAANGRASALKRLGRHPAKRDASENGATNEPATKNQLNQNHSSDTKVSGAEAPPIDPVKAMFDAGVDLLTATGLPAKQARSLIGKWRGQAGDDEVRLGIAEAQAARISDPVPWLTARFASRSSSKSAEPYADFMEWKREDRRQREEWERKNGTDPPAAATN